MDSFGGLRAVLFFVGSAFASVFPLPPVRSDRRRSMIDHTAHPGPGFGFVPELQPSRTVGYDGDRARGGFLGSASLCHSSVEGNL
jgi:hypothetical protein